MKKILATLVLAFVAVFAHAQGVIAVKGTTKNAVFTDLKAAYDYADAGDNIYLPGSGFSFTFEIKKKVNIIGVGYDPRVAGASGITTITGDINFTEQSHGSTVTGVYVTGTIALGTNNLTARRCNANRIWMGGENTEVTVTECVAREKIDMSNHSTEITKYVLNNITPLLQGFNSYQYAIVRNNIFLSRSGGQGAIVWITSGIIENNIFLTTVAGGGAMNTATGGIVWRNNIFCCQSAKIDFGQGTWEEGNVFGVDINSLFVSVPDPAIFRSSHNFHLKANSPARMGTESNEQDDAGIYGGLIPWKEGGLPPSPHVDVNNTAYSATGNKLQLRMKVKAQSN